MSFRKQSSVKTPKRRAYFDDENVLDTYHPNKKDYGMMPIGESKTPYPRKEDPVDAAMLREKLREQLRNINESSSTSSGASYTYVQSSQSDTSRSWNVNLFAKRRQAFQRGEFTLARQRLLSNELHRPLESVEAPGVPRCSAIGSRLDLYSWKTKKANS